MSDESKAHEMILKWVFARLFPGEEPVKVEVPPVEVYPFYPKFESVGDYLTALEYCMESELFVKHTYELLSSVARNDEARRVARELATIEQGHYEEIRRVYEPVKAFESRHVTPSSLEGGAYLLTDDGKAHYFLLDFLDEPRSLLAIVRENPVKFRDLIGDCGRVLWLTKTDSENSVPPEMLPDMINEISLYEGYL